MNVESDDTEPVSGQDVGAVPTTSTKHWSERPARWGLTGVSVNMLPTGTGSPYQNPNSGGDIEISTDVEKIQERITTNHRSQ